MPRRTILVGLGGVAALLALPAAASAVTATLDQPCYQHLPSGPTQTIVVTLKGGTPNGDFQLGATLPGQGFGSAGRVSGTFDADGTAVAKLVDVKAPTSTDTPLKGDTLPLSVRDTDGAGMSTPVAKALVTNRLLAVAARPRKIQRPRAITASGTDFAGRAMYAFVVKGTGSTVVRRIPLGRANACGYVHRTAIVAPPTFTPGHYRLYVNAGTTLRRPLALSSGFSIAPRS